MSQLPCRDALSPRPRATHHGKLSFATGHLQRARHLPDSQIEANPTTKPHNVRAHSLDKNQHAEQSLRSTSDCGVGIPTPNPFSAGWSSSDSFRNRAKRLSSLARAYRAQQCSRVLLTLPPPRSGLSIVVRSWRGYGQEPSIQCRPSGRSRPSRPVISQSRRVTFESQASFTCSIEGKRQGPTALLFGSNRKPRQP